MADEVLLARSAPEETAKFEVPAIFVDASADVTFQSSDQVTFKVFKGILIVGSTFFRNMFEHPRPSGASAQDYVPWDEPAATIVLLLYQLYPLKRPTIESFGDLETIVVAADKWGMDGILETMKETMLQPQFLDIRPFAVYALACRFGFDELKTPVKRRLVELYDPLDPYLRIDLQEQRIFAIDLVDMMALRKGRVEAVQRMLDQTWPEKCTAHGNPYDGAASFRAGLRGLLSAKPTATHISSIGNILPAMLVEKSYISVRPNSGCTCALVIPAICRNLLQAMRDPQHFSTSS
ncbi:hypothetical protein CALCODRAFT_473258 [Calocera cornea HHB12733]|uniref:BTB domain-containing protein n=1 Tax=Calocera cornea HHB12733 TaxID=1353952 RepID=A0A165ED63_9BASI|nr:hypothetical protein CALCODRAFT_473258 [Calocera cornea HHB12733]